MSMFLNNHLGVDIRKVIHPFDGHDASDIFLVLNIERMHSVKFFFITIKWNCCARQYISQAFCTLTPDTTVESRLKPKFCTTLLQFLANNTGSLMNFQSLLVLSTLYHNLYFIVRRSVYSNYFGNQDLLVARWIQKVRAVLILLF